MILYKFFLGFPILYFCAGCVRSSEESILDNDEKVDVIFKVKRSSNHSLYDEDKRIENFWKEYKIKFDKFYMTRSHERAAKKAWLSNMGHIADHNDKKNTSFKLAPNQLTDLTLKQYLKRVVKLISDENKQESNHSGDVLDRISHHIALPTSVDWRSRGFSPDIKAQGKCGACYAFSVAHALEAQIFMAHGNHVALSEQQLVDCGVGHGNYGCGGGSLSSAIRYLKEMGAMAERDYPYQARLGRCLWSPDLVVGNVASWGALRRGDEAALKRTVALLGPVAVSINAAPRSFQLYHSGVYDDPLCHSDHVNHSVLVMGYDQDHWIVLNWWGQHWGQQGYMKIKMGKNLCGIANHAVYVTSM